jgi:hypothetical protein
VLAEIIRGNRVQIDQSAILSQTYGEPIAMVHDMGAVILKAVKEVFPKIPDYICHFHFLKDIGKDLFGHDPSRLAVLRKLETY